MISNSFPRTQAHRDFFVLLQESDLSGRSTRKPNRSATITKAAGKTRHVALILPQKTLDNWTSQYPDGELPADVSVRYRVDYFRFTRGQSLPLPVIGNWSENPG
ncbi:MAG: hypothetical protein ACOCVL_03570 [Candidatus Sumerlaeota bacterium]